MNCSSVLHLSGDQIGLYLDANIFNLNAPSLYWSYETYPSLVGSRIPNTESTLESLKRQGPCARLSLEYFSCPRQPMRNSFGSSVKTNIIRNTHFLMYVNVAHIVYTCTCSPQTMYIIRCFSDQIDRSWIHNNSMDDKITNGNRFNLVC